ncbi:CD225/dispanin family protein [Arenimonas composti]|uniref:Zinc-ribbon domain-containing protein n=1 Tax=Arenimonas composti TR7-09 = DSM 18010 TaxID=1121013 RepID=A0A091BBS6_9GAMM|nr:CD225/dispanin family protein [Arenimonas composti]KFN49211.1 hypothetical protein P873_12205 [Arenimonas composti TR7-09 = DSM 18010]
MYCPNCGHDNPDTSPHCAACGTALSAAAPSSPPPPPAYGAPQDFGQPAYGNAAPTGTRPPNHLVWAIVSTAIATIASMMACCCLPLGLATGIPAIIFANKVDKLFAVGDEAGALDASGKAKLWSILTTVLGAIFLLLVILSFALQAMGVLDQDYLEQLRRDLEANR